MKTSNKNHLARETSPYLQQHAENPVDWYPWGEAALAKARLENKPILLSIGYAACHWCHVMAHESFEDAATAALMNRYFVNIKVDREERPDLDKIYQTAHYFLTQASGGWPLTIFLTPDDCTPFFSGTYFPPAAHYALPAFKDVLQDIANLYQANPLAIKQQNAELLKLLREQTQAATDMPLTLQPLQLAMTTLGKRYDANHGGFGQAPKFPQPSILEFLMQQQSMMAAETLTHMANGGIYDHLGGGFFRYAVDANWQIPHFEKMLYDNGQLLYLYAFAAKVYAQPLFADIAEQTAEWLMNEMQAPEGGYYASIDADAEGHEGKFYVWDKSKLVTLLTTDEYAVVQLYFDLAAAPNFEKHYHLHRGLSLQTIHDALKIPLVQTQTLLQSAKEKMLHAREQRVKPARDNKILTAWNALAIKGMLVAGDELNEPRFIDSAERALTFIRHHLFKQPRLLASYHADKTELLAYLDDYAYLIDALLTALQIKWNSKQLQFAMQLMDTLLTNFTDTTTGGFFFTANDHEKLLYRPKTMMDEVIPAGNAIAVRALLTLGHLLGESRYLIAAEKTLQAAYAAMLHYPASHCGLLLGLQDFLTPTTMIILRGKEKDISAWRKACKNVHNTIFAIPEQVTELPGLLALKKCQENTCAYVCRGMVCSEVMTDIATLRKHITAMAKSR